MMRVDIEDIITFVMWFISIFCFISLLLILILAIFSGGSETSNEIERCEKIYGGIYIQDYCLTRQVLEQQYYREVK